jgi:hypothetical protein
MSKTRAAFIDEQLLRVDGAKAADRLPKHRKMCTSPFVFFRGSSSLFYADLAAGILPTPQHFNDVQLTSITGDCHTSNFGFFTEQGSHGDKVVFSINDFDDACVGNAYWDIIRFAVSLALAADHCQGLQKNKYSADKDYSQKTAVSRKQVSCAIEAFISAYLAIVKEVLCSHDNKSVILNQRFNDFNTPSVLKKRYKKACSVALGGEFFFSKSSLAKAVDVTNIPPTFKLNAEKFTRKNIPTETIKKQFSPYFFDNIVDIVGRINSGTGSVNMGRFYLLLGPKNIQSIDEMYRCHVVEVKQQRHAAPISFFPEIHHQNHLNPAHLTVKCQRRMQNTIDYCLDEAYYNKQHWLIRSRHHAKVGINPEHIGLGKINAEHSGFEFYAEACAQELARAHCRADMSSVLFEQTIVNALNLAGKDMSSIAINYAEQVKLDWQWLCKQQT